ncbi:zinc finger CCCH domain-containing protein 10-like isoform X2 [Trichoplusia ni]|uniref:Zinc finger CCCH domain-containing protein 10-like isoform X2 n=1 Tax=Trichoplusia ni TaxID=7111 RepID=A0A7E5WG87_TRINI|nr:zinc finger CCCH domain-containing protein 10-like isoform X2 [Trichoplusia ni]
MQGSEPEKKSKSRSDEDSINFRPSPNFKHMRKYLKSKFEEAKEMANPSASNGTPDSTVRHDQREEVNKSTAPVVQPPLPPNPPPPESPPIINLKKEIEDDEYGTTESNGEFNHAESLLAESIKTDQSEVADKPEVTMCRNFARGTCKKGTACKFAHELILSQLPGVYTFCRNFQNSVCTYPKCKFVHATVFEKEHFFRTGYLPPHTLAHLKETNVLQPPPPPPPPEETATDVSQVFANGPPPQTMPCITPGPVLTCAPAPSLEITGDTNIFRTGVTSSSSPKREWSDSDDFSSSPRDIDSSEPLAKKCKSCDNNEFRYQYNKFKVEKMMRSTEDMNNKIAALNKKSSRLYTVLVTLFKPTPSGNNGLNINPEKEDKMLVENINRIIAGNIRIPHNGEETNLFQSMLANPANVTAILAKILLSNGNPSVPPDSS